jgi:hypothetical protein
MPLFAESRSRRAWRREVAELLVSRVDRAGYVRFVGYDLETRREMIMVARMLPHDIDVELYEDQRFPGQTFMELRLRPMAAMPSEQSFRVVHPGDTGYREQAV